MNWGNVIRPIAEPDRVCDYFLAGAAGVTGAVTAGLAAGAGAFDGFTML